MFELSEADTAAIVEAHFDGVHDDEHFKNAAFCPECESIVEHAVDMYRGDLEAGRA